MRFANPVEYLNNLDTQVITADMYDRVEDAIDRHGRFVRAEGILGEPSFHLSRQGCTVNVRVRLGRKKGEVSGQGETPEEAVNKLIEMLDYWVKVW